MMKIEILSVGTELLCGQICNTNAQYISQRLPEVGCRVFYHTVVGDNADRLEQCLNIALNRCDIVITTGGLGPTQDDLTKDTIAKVLGRKMVLHQQSANRISDFFHSAGHVMVESNLRQAYFPEGCIILENDMGTAPGCIVENEDKIVVMLPGPPKELNPMFDRLVMKYFRDKSNSKLFSSFVMIVGKGESLVEEMLMPLVDGQTNPTLATYAKDGIVTLRVTANDKDGADPKELVSNMVDKVCNIMGGSVYSTNYELLEYVIVRLLKEKKLKLAIAESCTGGMLSQIITSIPGSSEVLECGIVTYSNEAKIRLLGVRKDTISSCGAVSSNTALEMVKGIITLSGADIGISITGIAGPGGGSAEKPVGLVYIGIKNGIHEEVVECHFTGNRDRIRTLSAIKALDLVRNSL